jgi:predicted phage terminase large subunit-like protein
MAGSGKSYLGAMDFLKYTDDPNFRALVTRRINPQIHGPGGIFETFVSLHRKVYGDKLKVKRRDGVLEYPSGATITFRHCQYEDDKHSFQGWQLSAYLGDEIQQMTQSQVVYIMSRLRTDAKNKPVFRGTCNPAGKGHWLTNWIEWYLLPSGLPDESKCGVKRYFTMRDNEIVWADTPAELKQSIPGCNPLSFTFINANIYDNPVLMGRNPEYLAWLEGQDRETKEALLYGNWYVTKQHEGYFKRQWTQIIAEPPFLGRRVRGFDMAGSIKDEVNKDPDYTATVLISKTNDGQYTIEHAHRIRERFHTVEQFIFKLSENDPPDVTYVIPVDAGAAGKAYASTLQQSLAERGRHVRLHPTGNKSKLIRFRPFASVCESGHVKVVSADWNDWFFDELEQFKGDGKQHDDALDAAVSAFWYLNRQQELPAFNLPSLAVATTVQQSFVSDMPYALSIPRESFGLPAMS